MVEQRPATQFEKSDPGTPDRPSFLPDLRRICLALPNKDEAAAFLKLLANDKRLLILDYLLTGDERSVEEIGIDLDIRQPSLSQHLAKLRNGPRPSSWCNFGWVPGRHDQAALGVI